MAETITIIDDRTGKKVTVPVTDGVFASSALRDLDPNLRMYDPAFLSTAACQSAIILMASRESFAIADTRLNNWPRSQPLPKWLTCFSTESFPIRSNWRNGITTSRTTR
jgi:hypothetical protein